MYNRINHQQKMDPVRNISITIRRSSIINNVTATTTDLLVPDEAHALRESFQAHQIVPDILDRLPEHKLPLSHGELIRVELGNLLAPEAVQSQPELAPLAFTEHQKLYSLIMTDPDVPNRAMPTEREFLHWMVVNLPAGESEGQESPKLWAGHEIFPYEPPLPRKNSGLHRYVFLLMEQSERINPAEALPTTAVVESIANRSQLMPTAGETTIIVGANHQKSINGNNKNNGNSSGQRGTAVSVNVNVLSGNGKKGQQRHQQKAESKEDQQQLLQSTVELKDLFKPKDWLKNAKESGNNNGNANSSKTQKQQQQQESSPKKTARKPEKLQILEDQQVQRKVSSSIEPQLGMMNPRARFNTREWMVQHAIRRVIAANFYQTEFNDFVGQQVAARELSSKESIGSLAGGGSLAMDSPLFSPLLQPRSFSTPAKSIGGSRSPSRLDCEEREEEAMALETKAANMAIGGGGGGGGGQRKNGKLI